MKFREGICFRNRVAEQDYAFGCGRIVGRDGGTNFVAAYLIVCHKALQRTLFCMDSQQDFEWDLQTDDPHVCAISRLRIRQRQCWL